MTRAIPLPTVAHIEEALSLLRSRGDRPVSTSGLAAHLGLSNTTFWRHFPSIAQRVSDERRAALRAPAQTTGTSPGPSENEAKLRRDLAALRAQFELAIAHIQRLTLELEDLRRMAESDANISHLGDRRW